MCSWPPLKNPVTPWGSLCLMAPCSLSRCCCSLVLAKVALNGAVVGVDLLGNGYCCCTAIAASLLLNLTSTPFVVRVGLLMLMILLACSPAAVAVKGLLLLLLGVMKREFIFSCRWGRSCSVCICQSTRSSSRLSIFAACCWITAASCLTSSAACALYAVALALSADAVSTAALIAAMLLPRDVVVWVKCWRAGVS